MQDDNLLCNKCACTLEKARAIIHPVRSGYSKKHFPLFHYHKVTLCEDCHARQKKIDILDRILAIVALGMVIYFFSSWVLLYF